MADSDKNIVITPATGTTGLPEISFVGSNNDPITLKVLDDNSISFVGSEGQLFSLTNNLSSGIIYSVSDISGTPLIEADAAGRVFLTPYNGRTHIGTTNTQGNETNTVLEVRGKVSGGEDPIALANTSNASFILSQYGTGIGLHMGVQANTSPQRTWLQCRHSSNGNAYNLSLQPLGGQVIIGGSAPSSGSAANGTHSLIVRNETRFGDATRNAMIELDGRFSPAGVDYADEFGISFRIENGQSQSQTTTCITSSWQPSYNCLNLQPAGGNVGVRTNNPEVAFDVNGVIRGRERLDFSAVDQRAGSGVGDRTPSAQDQHYSQLAYSGPVVKSFYTFFPNQTANRSLRIYFGNQSFWGCGTLIINGNYSWQNMSGMLQYDWARASHGATVYTSTFTDTVNIGSTSANVVLHTIDYDSSQARSYLDVRHIVSTGNAVWFTVKVYGSGVNYANSGKGMYAIHQSF